MTMNKMLAVLHVLVLASPASSAGSYVTAGFDVDPHAYQVSVNTTKLSASSAAERAAAAEALGFLRAYGDGPAEALESALTDSSAAVRRNAAMSLGWCSGRKHVASLLRLLSDEDWTVRQAAWVALTNITGMEFPFDGLALPEKRVAQARVWQEWWKKVPADRPPSDVLALVTQRAGEGNLAEGCKVSASSIYKGPASALTDRSSRLFWQTKNVPFPQHCTIDLDREETIACVIVEQYGARFCMTDYAVSTSLDGKAFDEVCRNKGTTPPDLVVSFKPRKARYVRVTSHGSAWETYPTTFYSVQVREKAPTEPSESNPSTELQCERGMRALAALGGEGAAEAVLGVMRYYTRGRARSYEEKAMVQVGIRALGRLRHPDAFPVLAALLDHDQWARYAADALADFGGDEAFSALVDAYPQYALSITRGAPKRVPADDRPGFECVDRMYETPYAFASALSRLPIKGPHAENLRTVAPLLAANLPGDFDGAMLYSPEAYQMVTAYLLEQAGLREAAVDAAFMALGLSVPDESIPADLEQPLLALAGSAPGDVPFAASWLTALYRGETKLPLLTQLLEHRSGWVRLNAAKTLKGPPHEYGPRSLVFIKGDNVMPNRFQIDPWRQTYSTTDSGPTYRLGANIYILTPAVPTGDVIPLTTFKDGYVADCEVSWDGTRVLFCRRGGASDPWWHVYEIHADGTELKQLTSGPYHDVQPAYLPDGRVVFSSTRIGLRDEYHGYPATGLSVMNPDGTDIHCIGFNLGRDNEPSVLADGRVLFSRLELFYSRLKTEITVQAVFPDGTKNITLYGPEKRAFWRNQTGLSGESWWGESGPRHRVLRLTQPQSFGKTQVLVATTAGPTIVGPGRHNERIIPRYRNMAVSSMFPLGGNRVLCTATVREPAEEKVDLGLYILHTDSGELTLVYNDPACADFEPRPLAPREPPLPLACPPRSSSFSARLLCNSVRISQEERTGERGKLLRVVEGQPVLGRHHTHTSKKGEAWKNHTGTQARVLGTIPLASDGSFFVEIPADRLVHCQVLDSDRRVVNNQLIWMYARPGETKSCIGCHEMPDRATMAAGELFPSSARVSPVKCLPTGGEFTYRAKAWQKGTLSDETEERTRTARAVSLVGRH